MTAQHEDYATALERAAKVIDAAESVTLLCHMNPDGDALARCSRCTTHCAWPGARASRLPRAVRDRAALPRSPRSRSHHEPPGDYLPSPPWSSPSTVARSASREPPAVAEPADELIVVDHHVSNDGTGRSTSSTRPPRRVASSSATSFVCSGSRSRASRVLPLHRARVRHRPVPVRDHDARRSSTLAGELVEWELPIGSSAGRCSRSTRSRTWRCSARRSPATLVREQSFVWASVTQEQLAPPRGDDGGDRGPHRHHAPDRRGRRRLRPEGGRRRIGAGEPPSVGATDVQHVAAAHGGGGHRFAAGFTSDVAIDATVARIRASL